MNGMLNHQLARCFIKDYSRVRKSMKNNEFAFDTTEKKKYRSLDQIIYRIKNKQHSDEDEQDGICEDEVIEKKQIDQEKKPLIKAEKDGTQISKNKDLTENDEAQRDNA